MRPRVPVPSPGAKKRAGARSSVAAEAASLGRACLAQRAERLLSHEAAVRAGDDVEAVHQMRVESRRLRALARVFRKALGEQAVDELRALLQVLGRALGAVRDIDVLRALSADLARRTGGGRGRAGGLPHAKAQRAQAQADLVLFLDSPSYARLQVLLKQLPAVPAARARARSAAVRTSPASEATRGPQEDALRHFARRAVGRELRRVRRRRKQAVRGEAEGLHALRRALKSLRYAVEALAPLLPPRARKLAPRAADLQDTLGAIHDADEWLSRAAPSRTAKRLLLADRDGQLAEIEARLAKLLRKKLDPLSD